ncbi:MAG: diheme cytochrome c-553 [Flavisolibacter sp.]
MRKTMITAAALAVVCTMGVISCTDKASAETTDVNATTTISRDSLIHRGEYLVAIMGCNDCHSPKVMGPQGPQIDSSRLLSGHPADLKTSAAPADALQSWVLLSHSGTAAVGPWGTSYAANISSDETGIGNWTEEQFFKAIREGKYKGMDNTRPLLPPMPWQAYRDASDEDLKAIFAYLKSTPPVDNNVPAPQPPAQP